MKVLFICTANVCRSPLAEGYLKNLQQKDPLANLEIASAGVLAREGSQAFDCSIEVAQMNGFDLKEHTARQLTLEMAQEADMILCMETWQAARIYDMGSDIIPKTLLLGSFHPAGHRLFQIPDPKTFTVPHTLQVFQLIQQSVEALRLKLTDY